MPGNLDESELISRITAEDETERMPPKSLGRTLSPHEIDLLKRWVEQGAELEGSLVVHSPAQRTSPRSAIRRGPATASIGSCWLAWTPRG